MIPKAKKKVGSPAFEKETKPEPKFKVGQLVCLISGSVEMIVRRIEDRSYTDSKINEYDLLWMGRDDKKMSSSCIEEKLLVCAKELTKGEDTLQLAYLKANHEMDNIEKNQSIRSEPTNIRELKVSVFDEYMKAHDQFLSDFPFSFSHAAKFRQSLLVRTNTFSSPQPVGILGPFKLTKD